MKPRSFTKTQYRLLEMRQGGYSTEAIAYEIGIHPRTVQKKEQDIARGLKKGAYIIPPELKILNQPGLF